MRHEVRIVASAQNGAQTLRCFIAVVKDEDHGALPGWYVAMNE